MDDIIDLLQIKIEKAKRELLPETLNAIAAVNWQDTIATLREKKGFSFEQLSDLEIETELLLYGLIDTNEYKNELKKKMGLSKKATDELIEELNELIFRKIKEELIKNTERKRIFNEQVKIKINTENETEIQKPAFNVQTEKPITPQETTQPQNIQPSNTSPRPNTFIHPILTQKISNTVETRTIKTEHTLDNITKKEPDKNINTNSVPKAPYASYPPKADPYRLSPDE